MNSISNTVLLFILLTIILVTLSGCEAIGRAMGL